jgi:alanyl aminopeptidase
MSRISAVLPALTLFASVLLAQTPPKLRLPGDVQPLLYALDLTLDPAQDGYSGKISIDVEVNRPAQTIWLNATGLKITKAQVGPNPAQVVDGGRDFIGLQLARAAEPGKARIDLEFTGTYRKNDVEGLFKQSDAGSDYIFTQFEPISARQAFPCFDEPGYKVPWKVTLRVPKGQGAFSNTPIASQTEEGGMTVVRFGETKPLPSYLVAMAVGPFDVVEGGRAGENKFPVRVLALKGRGSEAAYITSVTPKIIGALEGYFGMPYPYEKLDQVAIPITVGFGAMENAGLITYMQTILLASPEYDTITRQRRAVGIITHELAHQWFGNMVTPAWWDDIWLNEAFATWTSNKIVAQLFPAWNIAASAVENKAKVEDLDQMMSARKIRQPIEEPGDIGNAFDGITYQKGAAVIRMFENYVGTDRFQRGVQAYLEKHMWGNATASDFLASISGAAGQNIAPAFSKFLDRGGVPLLNVELKCDGKPRLAVTQERSLPLGSKGSKDVYWPTPVCLRYEAGGKVSRQCVMVSDPKEEIPLKTEGGTCPAWITANDGGTGYYHLLYGDDLQKKLVANSGKLSTPERVDLLRNTLAMLSSGRMPAGDALSLAREFRKGPAREIIAASMDIVRSVRKSVPPESRASFAKMIREYFGEKAHELGWHSKQGESADAKLLRPEIVELVAGMGEDPKLAAEAKALALAWLKNRKAVQPELVAPVLEVAAYHGDRELYDQLLAAAKASKVKRERGWIIEAIGNFRDPGIARSALGLMLTNELDVRELTPLLGYFQANPETERVPWEFVTANYDKLLPRLPSLLGTGAGSILPTAGGSFCDEKGYAQVEQFFHDRIATISGGARTLAKVLETIQLCHARVPAQAPEVAQFLKQYAD